VFPPAPAAATAPIGADEALTFVLGYYEQVTAGEVEQTWPFLSEEFRSARNLTFERYAGYWRSTSIEISDLRYTSGPATDEARVRFDAQYTIDGRVVAEVDELTLQRQADGSVIITAQRRVG
jgi:hypothetical protein